MVHHTFSHVAAYTVLISVAFVVVIDVLCESGMDLAIRIKWSAFWYAARYLAMASAIFLAIDTIF